MCSIKAEDIQAFCTWQTVDDKSLKNTIVVEEDSDTTQDVGDFISFETCTQFKETKDEKTGCQLTLKLPQHLRVGISKATIVCDFSGKKDKDSLWLYGVKISTKKVAPALTVGSGINPQNVLEMLKNSNKQLPNNALLLSTVMSMSGGRALSGLPPFQVADFLKEKKQEADSDVKKSVGPYERTPIRDKLPFSFDPSQRQAFDLEVQTRNLKSSKNWSQTSGSEEIKMNQDTGLLKEETLEKPVNESVRLQPEINTPKEEHEEKRNSEQRHSADPGVSTSKPPESSDACRQKTGSELPCESDGACRTIEDTCNYCGRTGVMSELMVQMEERLCERIDQRFDMLERMQKSMMDSFLQSLKFS